MRVVEVPGGACIVCEPGDPAPLPDATEVENGKQARAREAGIDWAKGKREKEAADAEDATVQSIIADLQQVKADIKAAASGPLTLTRVQFLKLARAVLWHIKDDKS